MDKPSFKGKWLLTLNKGSQINVIEIKDNWVKIEYQSQRGWVSKLLVANNPPAVKASHLEGQEKELRDKSRRRASENTTAAATRGLRSEERSRLSDEHHSDYKALEKVESQNVSEEETRKFHDEGIKQ